MYQKECIVVKFCEGLGLFDQHYGYPQIDEQEIYEGPTGKVIDIQGIQAHAGHDFFVPEGKVLNLNIDQCPYLQIAIKAEPGTNTCLFLLVHERIHDWKRRFVVIGKTPHGDCRYHLISNHFTIMDDNKWHEYVYDLRTINDEKDDNIYHQPIRQDAGSIREIQFYSWTGSGTHTFHFNKLKTNMISREEFFMNRENKTRFIPQVHGFKFRNSFKITAADLGLDMADLGDVAVSPSFGLCGGMSFAALDRFFSGRQVETRTDTPGVSDPLFDELLSRQFDSTEDRVWLKMLNWQTSPDMSHWNRKHSVGHRTKQEWPTIKASLDSGIPITLCLICVEGYTANPTINHQVVAYHYEENNERLAIWIYDPSEPEDPGIISVNFNLPKNNIDARASHISRVRGFFPVDYDRQEIIAKVRTARIDSCRFVDADAVTRDGRPVRRNKFRLRFSWDANFIPYYTLTLNRYIYIGPGPGGEDDIKHKWQPLPMTGSQEVSIITYGSAPQVVGLQIADTLEDETRLFPQPPTLTGKVYLHSPEKADWKRTIITDAYETWGDVQVVEHDPAPETVEPLSDRAILVEGEPDGDIDNPRARLAGFRTDFKLGYIAKPTFCMISHEWLFAPITFSHRIVRGLINSDDSITVLNQYQEGVIPHDQLDRFQLNDGFSIDDYSQDIFLELNLRGYDAAGQSANDQLKLYARSLLVINVPIYHEIILPDWDADIHEYVDREYLKQLTESLIGLGARHRVMHYQDTFVSKLLATAPRVWGYVEHDQMFKSMVQQTRLELYSRCRTKVAEVVRDTDSVTEFNDRIATETLHWARDDARAMARLCFAGIFTHLGQTGELERIIDSLALRERE